MADNFDKALPWVLIHEGGYVNHPKDPGGATNKGITHRTYAGWLTSQGVANKNVRDITDAEVAAIYREQYWDVVRGDDLPAGLDFAVFDFGVNSGPSRAAKYLQRLLGVAQDGWIGAETLGAVFEHPDPAKLIVDLCEARMAFLKRLKTFKTFGRGWTRRVMGETYGAQTTDHGTIDRALMLSRNADRIPEPIAIDDGAGAKGEDVDTSAVTSIVDAVKDKGAAGIGAGVTAGVTALSGLEGPVAYALAAVIVLAALAGLVWLVRRDRLA